jgi:hypothetical protein
MAETVMHCFDPGKAEAEGKMIGSLLAGYGELELEMANCLFAATGDFDNSIKKIFRIIGAEKRITVADAAMRSTYARAGVGTTYEQAISDMDWCRQIRNQYAHCQWYYTDQDRLCLVNLEDIAKLVPPITDLAARKVRVGLHLLEMQMNFFVHTRKRFWYLAEQCSRYLFALRKPGVPLPTSIHSLPVAMLRAPLRL